MVSQIRRSGQIRTLTSTPQVQVHVYLFAGDFWEQKGGGSDWVKSRCLIIIIHLKKHCSAKLMRYIGQDGTVL